MKLLKLRNIAMMGAMGTAGLGLIGAGAHAVFTTSTASSQTITAGTLSVFVSSPNAPGCTTAADSCTSLTLSPLADVGSTFDSPANLITITNAGNIPATEITLQVTDSTTNAMASSVNECLYSDGSDVFDEPLNTTVARGVVGLVPGTLAVGATDSYSADYYAGTKSSVCTDGLTNASLPTTAQGGTVTPTITVGYSG